MSINDGAMRLVQHKNANGQLHRTDGPAVHEDDSTANPEAAEHREWWVNGWWIYTTPDVDILEELYDLGETTTLEHVLGAWSWAGPPMTDLVDAVRAAHL